MLKCAATTSPNGREISLVPHSACLSNDAQSSLKSPTYKDNSEWLLCHV